MTEKKYPEGVYIDSSGNKLLSAHSKDVAERAYDLGYRDGLAVTNPTTGWSNLSLAINEGARIDWGALDGRKARCVHPEQGTLTYKLERDIDSSELGPIAWWVHGAPDPWVSAIHEAWFRRNGWTLYIEGEVPLVLPTANELEPGTWVLGKHPEVYSNSPIQGIVATLPNGEGKAVVYVGPISSRPASEVRVAGVIGKHSGNA